MKHGIYMKKSDGDNVDEIDIFGTIGEDWWGDSTTGRDVIAAIRGSKAKSIKVNINSGGGSIFEGMAMYDAIKGSEAKTTARVLGFSGSMASIVMLAADTVEIVDGALVMIHNPSTVGAGESKDLRKQADVLDKLRDGMVRIYSGKTGMDAEEITAMMDDETWLDAVEARSLGLVDKIVGEDKEAKACIQMLDLTASSPSAKVPLRFAAMVGAVSPSAITGTIDNNETEEEPDLSILEDIKEALGLEAGATDEEVLEAVQASVDGEGDEDEAGDEGAGEDDPAAPDDAEDEDDEEDEGDDAEASAPLVPEGMVLVDADTLEDLKARASASADRSKTALAGEIVAKAVSEGRIPAAKADKYLASLEKDFDTFAKMLTASEAEGGLAKGLVPVNEIGTAHDEASGEAGGAPVAYDASLFPQLNKSNANRIIETE